MARASLLLVAALCAFALVQMGDALKCYHCAASPGGDCDRPNKDMEKICDADQVCYFHNTTTLDGGQLTRGCGPKSTCSGQRLALPNVTCTTCEQDLCNSSSSVVPTFFVISIVGLMFAKVFV